MFSIIYSLYGLDPLCHSSTVSKDFGKSTKDFLRLLYSVALRSSTLLFLIVLSYYNIFQTHPVSLNDKVINWNWMFFEINIICFNQCSLIPEKSYEEFLLSFDMMILTSWLCFMWKSQNIKTKMLAQNRVDPSHCWIEN